QAVHAFFGDAAASLFSERTNIADQVMTGLGGPPNRLKSLSEGRVLASACRPGSCTEKVAVILSCPASIEAVGVLHYTCTNDGGPWAVCIDQPVLTIFRPASSTPTVAMDALRAWAINAVAKTLLPLTYDYRDQSNEVLNPPGVPGGG